MVPLSMTRAIVSSFFPGASLKADSAVLRIAFRETVPIKIKPKKPVEMVRGRDRLSFVIIDPGHGGKDPGAIGKGGKQEKIITLKIARYLEGILKKDLKGIPVYLTRRKDIFIELGKRTEYANKRLKKKNNGLFVSIHANASISPRISGYETYFLSQNPTNEDARNTAALENNVIVLEDGKGKNRGYGDVDYIEALMMTTQIQRESSMLAHSVQRGMSRKVRTFKSRGVRKADFFVLRGALMPAVLVEVGFVTNKKESAYLVKSSYQKKIAKGIAAGIVDFMKKYNKMIKK